MGNLSLNILFDSYVNVEAAESSVYLFLDSTSVDAVQVTADSRFEQGFSFAKRVKYRYPHTVVILRKSSDDRIHTHMTPQQWCDSFMPFSDNGNLVLSCNNEPGTGDIAAQEAFYVAILRRIGPAGIKAVMINMQTHNDFDPAGFRQTFTLCAKYSCPVGLHYYFDLENRLPVDPVHLAIARYCSAAGIKPLQYNITELGYAQNLASKAGYKGRIPGGGAIYGEQLASEARTYPYVRFHVYGWGKQDPWGDFDMSDDSNVQKQIADANAEVAVPTPSSTGVSVRLIRLPLKSVNVRSQPAASAGVLGGLSLNDEVLGWPNDTSDGWMYIQKDTLTGWVSLQAGAVVFSPIDASGATFYTIRNTDLDALKSVSTSLQTIVEQATTAKDAVDAIIKGAKPSTSGGGF